VNILGMGPMEALLIIIIALIVVGPAKLPEVMGQVGKAIGDFRRATSDLSEEFNKTIQAELKEGRSVLEETKAAVSDVHTTVNSAVAGTAPPPPRVSPPADNPAAPNGTSAEPYDTEATTNGMLPEPVAPLAETAAWSWETSAPATPPEQESSAPVNDAPESVSTHENSQPEVAETAEPGNAETSSSRDQRARDELLPPY
jgi:sec-independent protein translocase protein TatB